MNRAFIGQRRSISFLTNLLKGKSQNITEEIVQKPKVTGNGPFIEQPHFEPLGDPSRLLNIRLPQSSKANVRSGTIVAINGEISDISYDVKALSSNTLYQQLHTESSNSLVMSGESGNYSIIEIENGKEEWIILKSNSIIAWTDLDLKLTEVPILSKISSFKSSGKGRIVVGGDGPIYKVNLDPNEEILVNPNSLIASNNQFEFEVFNLNSTFKFPTISGKILRSKLIFNRLFSSLPNLGVGSVVRSYFDKLISTKNDIIKSISEPITKSASSIQLNNTYLQVKKKLYAITRDISLRITNRMINRKPIYFKIQGPAKLIVNNNSTASNYQIFSKEEINDIFKTYRRK